MSKLPDDLQPVYELVRSGRMQDARPLLAQYLRQHPNSEPAWWLMSFTLKDARQQIDCLRRVVALNPNHAEALARLTRLEAAQANSWIPPSDGSTSPPAAERNFTPSATPPPAEIDFSPAGRAAEYISPEAQRQAYRAPEIPGARLVRKRKPGPPTWMVALGLLTGFVVLLALAGGGYVIVQNYQSAQQTLHAASTQEAGAYLTAHPPVAVLPPTWTITPTPTYTPTPTLTPTVTETPTPTETPFGMPTETRTPVPAGLIGPNPAMFAPDFSLADAVTGELVSLSQYNGRPVMILFWTTWCSYCRSEMEYIERLYEEYQAQGFVVLGIDVSETSSQVRTYRSNHGLTFPLLLDLSGKVQTAYNVSGYPSHFFIRPSGKIASVVVGTLSETQMKGEIASINK